MTPEVRHWHRERAAWAVDRGMRFPELVAQLERDWLALLHILAVQAVRVEARRRFGHCS